MKWVQHCGNSNLFFYSSTYCSFCSHIQSDYHCVYTVASMWSRSELWQNDRLVSYKLLTGPFIQLLWATFNVQLRFDSDLNYFFKFSSWTEMEVTVGWLMVFVCAWVCVCVFSFFPQCIMAKERFINWCRFCVFPQLDLVPLYASQQTSRSCFLVCLTLPLSGLRGLSLWHHIYNSVISR